MTTKVPERPEQLEEALLDNATLKTLMGEDGKLDGEKLSAFVKQYAKNVYERDAALGRQLKDAVKEGMKAFAGEAGVERLPMGGDGESLDRVAPDPAVYRGLGLSKSVRRQIAATGRGPGVPLHGKWPSLGQFLTEISPEALKRNGIPAVLKDMSESLGADGGFVVPEEFRAELLSLALESALVRPRARIIPIGRSTVRIPAIRDASHASTVFGGVSAAWTGEAASLSTVTQPTFTQVALTARKLTGYTVASNELLADGAISLEALIMSLFSDALAYFEDDAFVTGTGAGQPLGVLNADALVSVAQETGQATPTIVYENIVKMFSRMLPQSIGRGVWYGHPDIFPQLAQLALNVGTGGSAVWLANAVGGPPATILGRPLILTEKAETLGTAGDLMFVDFGYYLIGDRQALTVAGSEHVNFTTDEMTWRFVQRVDGRPWLQTVLTPRNGTSTLSPFVSLATRS